MYKVARVSLVLAVIAATLGPACYAAAQQTTTPRVEQRDFINKLDDVRRSIERDSKAPRTGAATDQGVVDVCKRNPQLPQCRLNR